MAPWQKGLSGTKLKANFAHVWGAQRNRMWQQQICRKTQRNLSVDVKKTSSKHPTLIPTLDWAVSLLKPFEMLANICETNLGFANMLPDLETSIRFTQIFLVKLSCIGSVRWQKASLLGCQASPGLLLSAPVAPRSHTQIMSSTCWCLCSSEHQRSLQIWEISEVWSRAIRQQESSVSSRCAAATVWFGLFAICFLSPPAQLCKIYNIL